LRQAGVRSGALALGVAGAVMALAACGGSGAGSGSGGSSGAGSAGGSSSAAGSPVTLMIITPTGTSSTNYPEALGGARAAVRALNTRGGINGHPVTLDFCNPKNDVPTAQACAQKAADSHVLAVVSEFSTGGGVMSTLQKASIPSVGSSGLAIDDSDLSSPISFVIEPLILYPAVCPSLLKKVGVTHPAVVGYDLSASDRFTTLAEVGTKGVGLTAKPVLREPLTTSDWTPTASQLSSAHADGATLLLSPPATFALMKASGNAVKYCHSASTLTDSDLIKLGPAANNLVEASAFPELSQTAQFSELRRMVSELDADYRAGDADAAPALRTTTGTTNGWLSVQIVAKVGATVRGDLTSASLLAALNKTSRLDLQLIPPLDFTTPSPIPGTARLFNTTMRGVRWNSARKAFVPLDNDTYPALTILEKGTH
jgi:branched-chain amino acid transport system substrate-binding protein